MSSNHFSVTELNSLHRLELESRLKSLSVVIELLSHHIQKANLLYLNIIIMKIIILLLIKPFFKYFFIQTSFTQK